MPRVLKADFREYWLASEPMNSMSEHLRRLACQNKLPLPFVKSCEKTAILFSTQKRIVRHQNRRRPRLL